MQELNKLKELLTTSPKTHKTEQRVLHSNSTYRQLGKFESTALFLWLGLPSTLIRHENGALGKRSSNWGNLKTPAFRFRVEGRKTFWKSNFTKMMAFSLNTNPNVRLLLRIFNSFGVVWTGPQPRKHVCKGVTTRVFPIWTLNGSNGLFRGLKSLATTNGERLGWSNSLTPCCGRGTCHRFQSTVGSVKTRNPTGYSENFDFIRLFCLTSR